MDARMHVYADNAATTPLSETAFQAMLPYLRQCCGNPSSTHAPGREAARALREARERIAACLGAEPEEIVFTSGGSESDNQAILTAARLGAAAGKRHVISTAVEHHAVLRPLERLAREGYDVTLLPVPEDGIVRTEDVRAAIRRDTVFVSVMHANNEIGTVQPIGEIGAVCREAGVLFHTDAVQTAGHLPICTDELSVDLLSLSAHKFHGPKGIGALYVRRGVSPASLIEGGGQEGGRRAGTENIAAIVGMAAALEESCRRREKDAAHTAALRDRLIAGLSGIPGAVLNGDPVRRLPGNVSFCFSGIEGEALLWQLDRCGVYASVGSACTSAAYAPSHVLLALGRSPDLARGALRLTISAETTEEEIGYIVDVVRRSVAYLRECTGAASERSDE